MTEQITVPRAAWDAMREAVERLQKRLVTKCEEQLVTFSFVDVDLLNAAAEALTAANAVSVEPKVKLIPTAEEMGAPVEPQLVGCAYYESNGACCESGEPCKADVQNNSAAHPQATEPAPQEWISVDDQMPPPMERVLASEPRHRIVKVDMWFGPDFQWSYTHWMPLPAAPEAKQ